MDEYIKHKSNYYHGPGACALHGRCCGSVVSPTVLLVVGRSARGRGNLSRYGKRSVSTRSFRTDVQLLGVTPIRQVDFIISVLCRLFFVVNSAINTLCHLDCRFLPGVHSHPCILSDTRRPAAVNRTVTCVNLAPRKEPTR